MEFRKNLNRCIWYEKPIMLVRCIIYWHSFLHWSSLKFVYTSGKIHIQKFGWSTEVVLAPSPRAGSMDQVHRGDPWTGSTSGGPWTGSTGVVHEPGPREGFHGPGPQGWSMNRVHGRGSMDGVHRGGPRTGRPCFVNVLKYLPLFAF